MLLHVVHWRNHSCNDSTKGGSRNAASLLGGAVDGVDPIFGDNVNGPVISGEPGCGVGGPFVGCELCGFWIINGSAFGGIDPTMPTDGFAFCVCGD